MAIIVVLSGMSAFGLQGARESGRDGRRKADLETIRIALEMYRSDCGRYPIDTTGGGFYELFGASGFTGADSSCGNTNVYIESLRVPQDPSTGRLYMYKSDTLGIKYYLCAGLETETTVNTNCTDVSTSLPFANCGTGINCSYFVGN